MPQNFCTRALESNDYVPGGKTAALPSDYDPFLWLHNVNLRTHLSLEMVRDEPLLKSWRNRSHTRPFSHGETCSCARACVKDAREAIFEGK